MAEAGHVASRHAPDEPFCLITGQEVLWSALTLVVWWALWSLADVYLLIYTPWSELLALALAGVGFCAMLLWSECGYERQERARQRYLRGDRDDARRRGGTDAGTELCGVESVDSFIVE